MFFTSLLRSSTPVSISPISMSSAIDVTGTDMTMKNSTSSVAVTDIYR